MKHSLTYEVAQAIRRGERDYAQILHDMELVCAENNLPERPYVLTANQVEARNFIIRKLRKTA